MFPILWRHFLKRYLMVFSLSVSVFVCILIVSRFKEIARFAALSGDWVKTGVFTLFQIPFILPLALPVSALVASYLLFQRASKGFEIQVLRASGISLKAMASPILLAAALLAALSFSIGSSLSPFCWRESKALLYRETSANPLLLMQRQNLVRLKYAYLRMGTKKGVREASDFCLIAANPNAEKLNLVTSKKLRIEGEKLLGYDTAWLTYLPESDGGADSLLIENQRQVSSAAPAFSSILKKNRPRLEPNALSFSQLRIRAEEGEKYSFRAQIEIFRRLSLCLALFTFTLLGVSFGLQSTRSSSRKDPLLLFILALLVLISYLGLKTLKFSPVIACAAAFFPHLLILCCSLGRLSRIARGFK